MNNALFWNVLVRTGVSKEGLASVIRVIRIGEVGTKLVVISNRSTTIYFPVQD
jgi:hypothetical protein